MALQAVHVKRSRRSKQPRPDGKCRVGCVAVQNDFEAAKQEVGGREPGVSRCVQVLVADRRKITQINAAELPVCVLLTAVNSYLVTALHQSDREFLRKGFEPPIVRRDTPRSNQGNPHVRYDPKISFGP